MLDVLFFSMLSGLFHMVFFRVMIFMMMLFLWSFWSNWSNWSHWSDGSNRSFNDWLGGNGCLKILICELGIAKLILHDFFIIVTELSLIHI